MSTTRSIVLSLQAERILLRPDVTLEQVAQILDLFDGAFAVQAPSAYGWDGKEYVQHGLEAPAIHFVPCTTVVWPSSRSSINPYPDAAEEAEEPEQPGSYAPPAVREEPPMIDFAPPGPSMADPEIPEFDIPL